MREILNVIQQRKSSRGPFDPQRPVARHDLEQILEAARWAPTAHNMQNFEIVVVDDPALIGSLGRLKSPLSMEFIRENHAQLSFSEAELEQRKVGLLASRFPAAWTNPQATAEELAATVRPLPTAPTMLFMVHDPARRAPASEGDFLGAISLGCATENMWLMAEALGIAFHVASSYADDAVQASVRRLLGVPDPLRLVYAIRLGYPLDSPQAQRRVRRDVQDFTHHNAFGRRGLA